MARAADGQVGGITHLLTVAGWRLVWGTRYAWMKRVPMSTESGVRKPLDHDCSQSAVGGVPMFSTESGYQGRKDCARVRRVPMSPSAGVREAPHEP
jgi:hypothetical protein